MRDPIVEFQVAESSGVLVARLIGEIDASNAGELRLAVSDRLASTSSGLILDLSEVAYLDSSGIHLLFDLGRRLRTRRQVLLLVVPEEAPTRRVLTLCNINGVAPMVPTVEAAMRRIEDGWDLA